MFYRQHLDAEDDRVITLDSGSIDSEGSDIQTPTYNAEALRTIMSTDSQQIMDSHRRGSTRGKIKELFRTFSWRNKSRESLNSKSEHEGKDDEEVEDKRIVDNDQFSFSNSPVRTSPNDSPTNTSGNLYDNTQPMLYLPRSESPQRRSAGSSSNQENKAHPLTKSSPSPSEKLNEPLNPLKTRESIRSTQYRSPIRSLSRKFSIFSIRSRQTTSTSTTQTPMFDLTSTYSYFQDETKLTNWRIPDFNKSQILMCRNSGVQDLKKDNSSEDSNEKKIHLFWANNTLNKTDLISRTKTRELAENENIDKLLYYPFRKPLLEKHYIQKGNYISGTNEDGTLAINSDLNFSIYNDSKVFDSFNRKNHFERDGGKKISGLTIKSFHLQESLEHHISQKKLLHRNQHYHKKVDLTMEVNNAMARLDVENYIHMQTSNKHIQPFKIWKLWITLVDKSKSLHGQYTLYTNISEFLQVVSLQNSFDTLIDFYVQEKNQLLHILKDDEIPIFHGKHKIKAYGEYVFIVFQINARQVWKALIELLITEKLNTNSVNLEVIGVSWRRYNYLDQVGYQVTLFVDERLKFDEKQIGLFLSDVRLIVPEDIRHCFKKCKTVFPGDKETTVIDVL